MITDRELTAASVDFGIPLLRMGDGMLAEACDCAFLPQLASKGYMGAGRKRGSCFIHGVKWIGSGCPEC